MKFFLATSFYGGDIPLIEQAARDCHAQLIAVKGYALEDYPAECDREYVEGSAEYLFSLEGDDLEEAQRLVHFGIHNRARALYFLRHPDELQLTHPPEEKTES